MSALEKLLLEARHRRDAAISQARARYKKQVKAIERSARPKRLTVTKKRQRTPKRRLGPNGDYSKMYGIEAAELILSELGPLRLTELAVEVQHRGCRSGDSPRAVGHTIRISMLYHSERFSRDGGRWGLLG